MAFNTEGVKEVIARAPHESLYNRILTTGVNIPRLAAYERGKFEVLVAVVYQLRHVVSVLYDGCEHSPLHIKRANA